MVSNGSLQPGAIGTYQIILGSHSSSIAMGTYVTLANQSTAYLEVVDVATNLQWPAFLDITLKNITQNVNTWQANSSVPVTITLVGPMGPRGSTGSIGPFGYTGKTGEAGETIVGSIVYYIGSNNPVGWLKCDGTDLSGDQTYNNLLNLLNPATTLPHLPLLKDVSNGDVKGCYIIKY
jgi:hypothetical protein